jgi:methylglyoxal synthase
MSCPLALGLFNGQSNKLFENDDSHTVYTLFVCTQKVALAELAHILDEDNGKFSISEQQSFGGQNSSNIANLVKKACDKFKKDDKKLLQEISMKIFPYKDMLCIQNASIDERISKRESREVDLTEFLSEDSFEDTTHNPMDPDFKSAFSPSAMRCLALVSHNGMKSTMREFVMTNKNLLKKFRLTGTNSTMTMLKEVFKDEDPGTVMFGPSCASGPLGGDAELVAHMVSGKIGGVIFFQDPMDAHPHRADIDCLVRQALVHNTMMAETPTSAIMLLQCLRTALMENRAELIPSFFFSLQSPTVEAYKAQQSAVVNMQKQNVHNMMKEIQVAVSFPHGHDALRQ